jgi:hypothetical protein
MVMVVVVVTTTVANLDNHLCTHWNGQRCEEQQQQEAQSKFLHPCTMLRPPSLLLEGSRESASMSTIDQDTAQLEQNL